METHTDIYCLYIWKSQAADRGSAEAGRLTRTMKDVHSHWDCVKMAFCALDSTEPLCACVCVCVCVRVYVCACGS